MIRAKYLCSVFVVVFAAGQSERLKSGRNGPHDNYFGQRIERQDTEEHYMSELAGNIQTVFQELFVKTSK